MTNTSSPPINKKHYHHRGKRRGGRNSRHNHHGNCHDPPTGESSVPAPADPKSCKVSHSGTAGNTSSPNPTIAESPAEPALERCKVSPPGAAGNTTSAPNPTIVKSPAEPASLHGMVSPPCAAGITSAPNPTTTIVESHAEPASERCKVSPPGAAGNTTSAPNLTIVLESPAKPASKRCKVSPPGAAAGNTTSAPNPTIIESPAEPASERGKVSPPGAAGTNDVPGPAEPDPKRRKVVLLPSINGIVSNDWYPQRCRHSRDPSGHFAGDLKDLSAEVGKRHTSAPNPTIIKSPAEPASERGKVSPPGAAGTNGVPGPAEPDPKRRKVVLPSINGIVSNDWYPQRCRHRNDPSGHFAGDLKDLSLVRKDHCLRLCAGLPDPPEVRYAMDPSVTALPSKKLYSFSNLPQELPNAILLGDSTTKEVESCNGRNDTMQQLSGIPVHSTVCQDIWSTSHSRRLPSVPTFVLFPDDESKPITIVPRNPVGSNCYLARELHSVHGIVSLNQVAEVLKEKLSLPSNRCVLYFDPNTPFAESSDMRVWNEPNPTAGALVNVNVEELEQFVNNKGNPPSNVNSQTARQPPTKGARILNAGYYGNQNCSKRDSNGVTIPTMRKDSTDPILQKLFVAGSKFLRTKGSGFFKEDMASTQRFSSKIDEENCIPAMTLINSKFAEFHRDDQNASEDGQSCVLGACVPSKLHEGNYVSAIWYQRRSISDYFFRSSKLVPLVQHFQGAFKKFEAERKDSTAVHRALTLRKKEKAMPLRPLQVKPCLDPLGFYNIGLICILTLLQEMELTLFDLFGMLNGLIYSPNTYEPCLVVTRDVLQGDLKVGNKTSMRKYVKIDNGKKNPKLTGQEGSKAVTKKKKVKPKLIVGEPQAASIPRWFLGEMAVKYEKDKRLCNVRFNTYRGVSVPSQQDFDDKVSNLLQFVFGSCWKHEQRPNNKDINTVYQGLIRELATLYPGCKRLIPMHFLAFLSYLGLVPQWIRTYATWDKDDRVWKYFADRFKLDVPGDRFSPKKVMDTLCHALKMDHAGVENIACKIYQARKQKEGQAIKRQPSSQDVVCLKAPFIVQAKDHLLLYQSSMSSTSKQKQQAKPIVLQSNVLINGWPIKGKLVGMSKVSKMMRKSSSSIVREEKYQVSSADFTLPQWWKKEKEA